MNPSQQKQLFRQEALAARQTKWIGDIVLMRPLSFSLLTAFAAAAAAVVLAFLFMGSYTKRSTVSGQLVPDSGLIKVFAQQPGIVVSKHVREGQSVRQGDVLYVVSSERYDGAGGDVQAKVSAQVQARRHSLLAELEKTRALQRDERTTLERRIASLRGEADKLVSQIDGQRSRLKLSEDTLVRYTGLAQQNFISRDHLQQRQEDVLEQRARLHGLERDQLALTRELNERSNELGGLDLRQQNQLAQIERGIAGVAQELTESEAKRRLVVTASQSGVATATIAEAGQAVDAGRPLTSIVPAGARLEAHLYAPSSAVGFIRPGQAVLLRYQAFPYQKFGHGRGVVASVSRTAVAPSELVGNAGMTGESMYRITVRLQTQSVIAYGVAQPLQSGMQVSADVMQESRRLYEWVLEPLFSLTGKL